MGPVWCNDRAGATATINARRYRLALRGSGPRSRGSWAASRSRWNCIRFSRTEPQRYRLVRLPQGSGGASVVRGISQNCAGETFGYAAQGRSQRPQTCRVDAPWYGTRAMQVTTPRGQNCARRAQFCVSALCPPAPTPFEEISRNLIQRYSATRASKICIS